MASTSRRSAICTSRAASSAGSLVYGIIVNLTADGSHIFVKDTIMRNNITTGIYITTSTGTVRASIDNCRSERNGGHGFLAYNNSRVTINRSVASGNGDSGFFAFSNGSGTTAELSCEECVASNNADGFVVYAVSGGVATIRVSHSTATNNNTLGSFKLALEFSSRWATTWCAAMVTDTSGTITVIGAQ